ncbi:hypothetical protein ACQXZ6_05900 [Corynebacterium diphtheriae]
MNGLDDWADLAGKFGSSFSIYQKVMHAIQNSGARVYLEGVDVNRLNARYRYPDNPHEVTLRHLLERVNEYCAQQGEKYKIIADTVPQEDAFNAAIQMFTRLETPGYRAQQLYCVEGDIEFVDSLLTVEYRLPIWQRISYADTWKKTKLQNPLEKLPIVWLSLLVKLWFTSVNGSPRKSSGAYAAPGDNVPVSGSSYR